MKCGKKINSESCLKEKKNCLFIQTSSPRSYGNFLYEREVKLFISGQITEPHSQKWLGSTKMHGSKNEIRKKGRFEDQKAWQAINLSD